MTWWYRWLCRLAGVLGAVCEYLVRGAGVPRVVMAPSFRPAFCLPELDDHSRAVLALSRGAETHGGLVSVPPPLLLVWRCSAGLGWDYQIPSLWTKLVHKCGRGRFSTG